MLHVLTIVVMVLVGSHSKPMTTYRMVYPTQYTCNEAEEELSTDTIMQWYAAKHKKVKVLAVKSSCESQRVNDDRNCSMDWYARCSDTFRIT